MKKATVVVLASIVLALALVGCGGGQTSSQNSTSGSASSTTQSSTSKQGGPGNARGAGGGSTQNDADAQAVIDATSSKFQQFTFTDSQTGAALEYSLYIPENANAGTALPLVMYMPDSTGANIGAEAIVKQYYGADVWASDESQAKNPAFVLVPAFTSTATTDNWEVSNEVEMTIRLIENLQSQYNIDAKRIYTTGQSMGCMASLYLNSAHPNFFAASMYVSGQWDVSVLKCLENQKFFYIVAGGDEKASAGQNEVMAMFDADGVAYSFGEWNAQNDQATQDAAVKELIAKGCSANMIRFESGSVLNGQSGTEHMASFNYAYKLTSVRDWLFQQSL